MLDISSTNRLKLEQAKKAYSDFKMEAYALVGRWETDGHDFMLKSMAALNESLTKADTKARLELESAVEAVALSGKYQNTKASDVQLTEIEVSLDFLNSSILE